MKPNNFPLITPVANTELYTQTNDVNGKFTMNSAKEFITSPEDITYSELYNKVANEELIPGSWYRLTDYKSVNFLNGWEIANNNPTPTDPNFNPQEIYTGETEVLLLQAISSYEISPIGYSETFQGDIVQYQPYTNKIGVDIGGIYNGQTLPDSSTVSGFDLQWDGTNVYFNMPTGYPALHGHYFYLYCEFNDGVDSYYQDGAFEPLTAGIATCQYPYTSDDVDYGYPKAMSRIKVVDNGMKVILLDLVEADYNNYVVDTLYVDHVYALGDAYGWITKRIDTLRNITAPLDFRGRKYRRFEVDLSAVNADLGTGYYGIGDNFKGQGTTGNFKDFKVFREDGYDVFNIEWNDMGGADMYWYCGYNDNNVFLGGIDNSKIGNYFYFNTIGNSFSNNTIGDNFYYNTIGNSFQNNTIGNNFQFNTIGNSFQNNTIGNYSYNNTIGNYFQQNTIGINFQFNTIGISFGGNTIENNFYNNTIGSDFNNNTIRNAFNTNTVGTYFQFNIIENSFLSNTIGNDFNSNTTKYSVTSTDFSLATHVYGTYNCEIFRRSDSTLQLSYIDGTNTIQYSNITA